MSFSQPLLLLTLPLVAAVAAVLALALRRRPRYAVRYTNLEVLAPLARGSAWRRVLPAGLFLAALAAACVGLARPRVDTLVTSERATVVLVLDTSRSMLSEDVRPTRLAAAQAAAQTFVDRVPDRLRVGLVVFSGDAQVAAPPTRDRELVRQAIEFASPFATGGGTAIGDAIVRAVDTGLEAVDGAARDDSGRSLVSILFLSDGRQNRGVVPPLEGAARARAAGIPVHTIALGTESGGANAGGFGFGGGFFSSPDPETLRTIARMTGGEFTAARTAESLERAYTGLASRLGREPASDEVTYVFAAAAAGLVAAAALLGALWAPRLP
jgi:Ca-activated chloride channel family protein